MNVGILKEIKVNEKRVCMTPDGVRVMRQNGHIVLVETQAGRAAGFPDPEYEAAGATIVQTPIEIYANCDMVMHVKEPQPSEYEMIQENQIVFTNLHLAADEEQTRALLRSGAVAITYETIEKPNGSLPRLLPHALEIANKGWRRAIRENRVIRTGVNIIRGQVVYEAVAEAFGLDYTPVEEFI